MEIHTLDLIQSGTECENHEGLDGSKNSIRILRVATRHDIRYQPVEIQKRERRNLLLHHRSRRAVDTARTMMQSWKLVLPIQTRSDDKSNNHIGYGNNAVRREYLKGESGIA